jgi:cell division control protein 12
MLFGPVKEDHLFSLFSLKPVVSFIIEIEEKGFNVRLTIIDTPGFGDYVNNKDCWVPIVEFLDEQHQNHMMHESRGTRDAPDDLRVHVCLYFLTPTGHTYVFHNLEHHIKSPYVIVSNHWILKP